MGKPISDITALNLTGFNMCESGPSFTRKVRQLSKLKTLVLSGNPNIVLERAAVVSLEQLQSLITLSEFDYDNLGSAVRFETGITLNKFLLALKGKSMTDIVIPTRMYYNTVLPFDSAVLSASLLSSFSELRRLDIRYGSAIVDAGDLLSSACTAWKDLQVLQLDGNRMTGHIPECLANMSSLKVLGLGSSGQSSISGWVPDELGKRCVSTKSDHIHCRLCPNKDLPWCE